MIFKVADLEESQKLLELAVAKKDDRINLLEHQNQMYQEQITELNLIQKENARLEIESTNFGNRINSLQNENSDLNKEISDIVKERQNLIEKVKTLEQELRVKENQLQYSQQTMSN